MVSCRVRKTGQPDVRPIRLLERTCWATGALLLLAFAAAQIDARLGSVQAFAAFHEARAEAAAGPTAVSRLPDPDQSLWSPGRIAAYAESLITFADTPVGVLQIPRLSLAAPLFEGTDEVALNRGVGRIEGTADVDGHGNLGIAGHRDGYFRGLKDIAIGDRIELETLAGRRAYRVADTFVVDPDAVDVLAPTREPTVTLVTCYPFYFVGHAPQRFIVRAVLDGPDVSSKQ